MTEETGEGMLVMFVEAIVKMGKKWKISQSEGRAGWRSGKERRECMEVLEGPVGRLVPNKMASGGLL